MKSIILIAACAIMFFTGTYLYVGYLSFSNLYFSSRLQLKQAIRSTIQDREVDFSSSKNVITKFVEIFEKSSNENVEYQIFLTGIEEFPRALSIKLRLNFHHPFITTFSIRDTMIEVVDV